MTKILLGPITRGTLGGFWLLASLAAGSAVFAAVSNAGQPYSVPLASATFLCLYGLLFVWPAIPRLSYRVWNAGTRVFARFAREVILRICYCIVFVAVGIPGASLRLAKPQSGESMWEPLAATPTIAPFGQRNPHSGSSSREHWVSEFSRWCVQSTSLWALCLVPFLFALEALDLNEQAAAPTDIYTLF